MPVEHGTLCTRPPADSSWLSSAPDLLRARYIAGHVFPIALSTWWRWVAEGKAPRGIKITSRVTVWKKTDIIALVEKLTGDPEL